MKELMILRYYVILGTFSLMDKEGRVVRNRQELETRRGI